jgi:Tol biopolymer transport system component
MHRPLVVLILVFSSVLLVAGQHVADSRVERAYDAWDAGEYLTALSGFKAALVGPDGDRHFERIAVLTGELFEVTELAPDGRAVRFSPNGRHAAFDIGTRTAPRARVVEIGAVAGGGVDLDGTGVVFSPIEPKVAFLRVKPTPDLMKLREEFTRLSSQPAPDRQAMADAQRKLTQLEAANAEIIIRDLASAQERVLPDGGLRKTSLAFSADGHDVYVVGGKAGDASSSDIYAIAESSGTLRPLTTGPGIKSGPIPVPGGRVLIYAVALPSAQAPPAGGGRGSQGLGGPAATDLVVLNLADRVTTTFKGRAPAVSADGSTLAFLTQVGDENAVQVIKLTGEPKPVIAKKSSERIVSVAVSPDGSRVTFDMPYTRNTEIFCVNADGTGEVRVSREIQPDRAPRFVTPSRILAVKGEPRHSRAYLYDLATAKNIRVFHNNTLRTIAPEYEWVANAAGTRLLIVAERDGDTISPERGVYLVDLAKPITKDALIKRIDASLAAEKALRARADAQFKPVLSAITWITDRVSIRRIYEYEAALFDFDSKHISQPGNRPAAEYIYNTLQSFGYRPEYQTFTARGDIKTSNVLATLKGLDNPELVYVLSSHFDSNQRGPGADDNSSATAVLLETARVVASSPMPATIIFAAFTGEEAGLLGSREFVRQAVEQKMKLVGALNNDMIGWTNDHRLDNTIRYSNAGIRDLQHGASFLFSKMVTYDARYFKSTDAAAYFEAYGDIVGGFGSYPVLGNPYYHQPTDLLDTVNHQLLLEATKANVASIMRLACGPSRITGLKADRGPAGAIRGSWTPSPEKGVVSYRVRYGAAGQARTFSLSVVQPKVTIPAARLKPGTTIEIAVTAITSRGLESWDAARTTVAPAR